MNHASWNGLTPTDLVFPTFVFVVGVSVVFAFDARLARGATRARLAWHTVQRAVVLFLLGIVVNSFPFFQLQHMRFYGVLQRIAVCYLVVGLFYLWDNRASTKVVALVVALVGYWILVRWVPIPGVGTPGRDVPFMDMTQNLVSWIDRLVFPHHLYLYAPDHNVRDPEGLLSDLPAIGTALLGVLTGLWLRSDKPASFKANGLAVVALSSLALGYFWALWFPLNKNMWTSSFVLVAAGYSLAVLAFAFWAIEVRGWRKGWTWVWLVFGSNAIAAYMFSELLPGVLDNVTVPDGPGRHAALNVVLFAHIFAHIPNPHWAAFAYSVSFTAVCFIPVWILYRKKIFLKV
jgi:predicted acyltransferase